MKVTDHEKILHKLKLVLSWVGGLLALIGVLFVVIRLVGYADKLDLSQLQTVDWLVLSALSILYAIMNVALVLAWQQIMKSLKTPLGFWQAAHIYGMSQLAKYVPGNIFHLAGRQALGMAAGVPGWALAKSSVWELGLIAVAGALFGLLSLPLWWQSFPSVVALLLFVIVLIVMGLAARRWLKLPMAFALGCYVLFLTVSGLIFFVVLSLVSSVSVTTGMLLGLVGAFVIAWLAGLLTPGAPAGVGVRELVLLFVLKGAVAEADLLLAVAIGRVVTVAGDLLFFLGAAGIRRKE
ncbi:hypothetical protein UF75_3469 [Desulfosporosinus sp. I2]|nr:hypothetical protein UF75_3469 [Desulfosporosinus sp. I2]